MGNQQSLPLPQQQVQQPILTDPSQFQLPSNQNLQQSASYILSKSSSQIFLIDPVSEIHLSIPLFQVEFLWIQKRCYSDEMLHILHRFHDALPKFEEFNDIQEFRQKIEKNHGNTIFRVISSLALPQQIFKIINRNRYIDRAILFCQNLDLAWYIRQKYPKFCQYAETSLEVLQKAVSRSEYKNSILFMLPEDIPVIDKYWINFFCLLKHTDRDYAKAHFLELAAHLYPNEQDLIDQFAQRYSTDMGQVNREKLVVQWMFKDSFYCNIVQKLSKVTNDPKKLAYLRNPVKDIYEVIRNRYRLIPNEKFNNLEVIHVVVELSEQEKQKISQSINNFMIFTSFVKGFTNIIAANNYVRSQLNFKNRNFFIFDVTIPKKGLLSEELDYGFIIQDLNKIGSKDIKKADVIFNIFNYFKITDFKQSTKSGTLIYGGLAHTYRRREREEYRNQLNERDHQLLRVYDNISYESSKIHDQGSVLRKSGHIDDSIIHNESKILHISSIGVSSTSAIQIDELNLEKGESLLLKQNYQQAIRVLLEVQSQKHRIIAYTRIIGIYIQQNQWKNARDYLNRIIDHIDRLKNEWNSPEEYFRARHYRNWMLMEANNYREARKQYKQLKQDIQLHYDYKNSVLPFMKEIIQNLQKCNEIKNVLIQ